MTTEIINRNGKDYAVIPYDFYQQLVEDAEMLADIKAYDIAKNQSEETQIDIQKLTEIEQNISIAKKKNIETIADSLNIDLEMII